MGIVTTFEGKVGAKRGACGLLGQVAGVVVNAFQGMVSCKDNRRY
jgi:hypothetical protein